MATNVFDKMAGIQFGLGGGKALPPDVTGGRVAFGTTLEIANKIPDNPAHWNDTVESVRNGLVNVAAANPALTAGTIGFIIGGPAGAVIGTTAGFGVVGLDKVTNGGASKLLQAGAKNFRSNYAFVRDVSEKNTGMGLLAGLTMIAGGAIGGVLGSALGPAGAIAGASLGAAIAGKATRDVSASEIGAEISGTLNKSAKFARSQAGQEKYNIGRDVTRNVLAQIPGFQTIGDTSKGIGAITSGVLNFGAELAFGADVAAAKLAGAGARAALVRPIAEPMTGFQKKIFGAGEAERVGQRLADDVDLIKRTMAGEDTPYKPVFDFYQNNKGYELAKRKEFDSEIGQVSAHLFAGKSYEEIGNLFMVGRGYLPAVEELATKHAATFAELARYEDAIESVSKGGIINFQYKGNLIPLSKRFTNNLDMVKAEAEALRKENAWLDSALQLDGAMKDRTVSRWAYIEKIRNDFAKEGATRNLAGTANFVPETKIGSAYQWVYQRSPLSAFIRGVDRITNDAPNGVINYNEPVVANTRLAASLREAEKVKASVPDNNVRIFDKWTNARTESEKNLIIEEYVATGMKMLAKKHGIAPMIIDDAIDSYITNHRLLQTEARRANSLKQGYMNDPQDPNTLYSDPQLITQLANGSMLPDFKLMDKALKEFAERNGQTASIPMRAKDSARILADEVNSLWRSFTLLRSGYPINVVKDAHIRAWGDTVLFDVWKNLGEDAINATLNTANTVTRINRWALGKVDKNKNMQYLRTEIDSRVNILDVLGRELKKAGYDVNNPPKKINQGILLDVQHYRTIEANINSLRLREAALIKGIKPNRIRKQTVELDGEVFEAAGAGRFGQLFMSKITQKDDIRRAMASIKELAIENARRVRTNSRAIMPTDESTHLLAWEQILNDKIRFDPVARMIAENRSPAKVVEYLRSSEGFNYLDRFGAKRSDAPEIYDRVKAFVDQYAPTNQLKAMIVQDKVSVLELKKLYPDVNTRPPVFTDMADDMLGTSGFLQQGRQFIKDSVATLSTWPTSKLAFNPYFRVKYEQELQTQLWVANSQGRKLTIKDKARFEQRAREYALREYREKLNSFHRDMNYSGITNYLLAFFPAVVEQFRAYGRITLEHPDFLIKKLKFASSPEQFSEVKEDANGNKYFEVDLPYFGLKSRIPTSWFNPDNPTGGDIISVHPFVAASVNEIAKRANIENRFTDMVLPFGVQQNSLNALQPNTVRRLAQVFKLEFLGNDEQFNKDVKMFVDTDRVQFARDNDGRQPNQLEYSEIVNNANKKAFYTAVLRFMSAATLPVQGRLTTPISGYVDILNKMQKTYGENATEVFIEKYPEYYMLADRLTDPISGINKDRTAVNLLRRNQGTVQNIVAGIGEGGDLTTLGAIFNDDNYAFSSAASAWLSTHNIPGTSKKFASSKDAFAQGRSSIVSKGWDDFFKVQAIVEDSLKNAANPIDPASKYGQVIVNKYVDAYVNAQKTQNPIWFTEYDSQAKGGSGSRQADTVIALTIAIEDDKMWKDLSKQPKWELILDYMKFRYNVAKRLESMGTTIDAQKVSWLKDEVNLTVSQMRAQNTEFAKFYDRYFRNDKFDFVYEGQQ